MTAMAVGSVIFIIGTLLMIFAVQLLNDWLKLPEKVFSFCVPVVVFLCVVGWMQVFY
ncbi:hypothetical protein [Indiicoccus explosivorum]|uniref:hypothetical protein n=1 Tax=Indiicoccus explosivorum TaxID=1917864 RepID=UPI0013906E7D|nr:hypothetical protein [Indiicoccus explosivorum]